MVLCRADGNIFPADHSVSDTQGTGTAKDRPTRAET